MSKNHDAKFYVRTNSKPCSLPGGFVAPKGSIYGRYQEGNLVIFWVCDNCRLIGGKMPIHEYAESNWIAKFVDKSHPCYKWVAIFCKQLGYVPKADTEYMSSRELRQMMAHYRKKKKGSGSSISGSNQINPPLKWNEGTELAHWNGKGNASFVACSIGA